MDEDREKCIDEQREERAEAFRSNVMIAAYLSLDCPETLFPVKKFIRVTFDPSGAIFKLPRNWEGNIARSPG